MASRSSGADDTRPDEAATPGMPLPPSVLARSVLACSATASSLPDGVCLGRGSNSRAPESLSSDDDAARLGNGGGPWIRVAAVKVGSREGRNVPSARAYSSEEPSGAIGVAGAGLLGPGSSRVDWTVGSGGGPRCRPARGASPRCGLGRGRGLSGSPPDIVAGPGRNPSGEVSTVGWDAPADTGSEPGPAGVAAAAALENGSACAPDSELKARPSIRTCRPTNAAHAITDVSAAMPTLAPACLLSANPNAVTNTTMEASTNTSLARWRVRSSLTAAAPGPRACLDANLRFSLRADDLAPLAGSDMVRSPILIWR